MLTEKDKIATERGTWKNFHWPLHKHRQTLLRNSTNQCSKKTQEIEDNKIAIKVICKSFAIHESSKVMKENNVEKNLTTGSSHLLKVSTYDVEKILRSIDSKKSTGIDKIPPKLRKVSAKVLQTITHCN